MSSLIRSCNNFSHYHGLMKSQSIFSIKPTVQIITSRFAHVNVSPYIVTESPFKNETLLNKTKKIFGFGDNNIFALRRATVFHYQACTDSLDAVKFFQHLGLPDTLYSFYLLVQLHVWLCQVRSMREGPEGRILRNEVVERMWQDFDTRLDKLEVFSSSKRKSILNDLLFQHQGAMLSYDEGLLADDKTLAGAVWRTLYSKDSVDLKHIQTVVRYLRLQSEHLNSIGSRHWCLDGRFEWAPFPHLIEQKELAKSINSDKQIN